MGVLKTLDEAATATWDKLKAARKAKNQAERDEKTAKGDFLAHMGTAMKVRLSDGRIVQRVPKHRDATVRRAYSYEELVEVER